MVMVGGIAADDIVDANAENVDAHSRLAAGWVSELMVVGAVPVVDMQSLFIIGSIKLQLLLMPITLSACGEGEKQETIKQKEINQTNSLCSGVYESIGMPE